MPGSFKAEAIVLRSIRLGEADRVLHLYTRERGRIGAVAKGVRRTRSRFGGRLEPCARVALVLHEGRSDLCTVTAAETVHAHAALRERREPLERATQACDAVLRLFDAPEANQAAYNLLCQELWLLDAEPSAATRSQALAFRLKLLLAAGFMPELSTCASCGEREPEASLLGFSAAQGGVVCDSCEAGSFRLDRQARGFMAGALASPLAEAPVGSDLALRQADRAIAETLEYHANVRLRRVA
ncbi:MAG: DNA repair protein RecO [Thermoleophilaceae bacterium]|nr:DNA repair protein RecO [Thermoleophilaceae bacterium]